MSEDEERGQRASNVVVLPVRETTEEADALEIAERESIEALKEALDELRVEIRTRLHPADERELAGQPEAGGGDRPARALR